MKGAFKESEMFKESKGNVSVFQEGLGSLNIRQTI